MLNSKKLFELMQEKEIKNMYVLSKQTKIPYSTMIIKVNRQGLEQQEIEVLQKFLI